jgi:alpha-D-ribose 1-methylphosphonate 5-triphosphate synthase subunit PhnG
MTKRRRPVTGFTLAASELEWLKKEAEKSGDSVSRVVSHLIRKHMEQEKMGGQSAFFPVARTPVGRSTVRVEETTERARFE